MYEDETESSIHDLDHAPAPPDERPTAGGGMGMEFMTSRSSLGNRSWAGGDRNRQLIEYNAKLRIQSQRRSSLGDGSLASWSSNQSSHHPLDLSTGSRRRNQSEDDPRRQRRSSAGGGSLSSNQSAHYPPDLGNVKSFSPPERQSQGEKKVGFDLPDDSLYRYADTGMLRLPEVSTEAEESEDYGYGYESTDRDAEVTQEERPDAFSMRQRADSQHSFFSASDDKSENTEEEEAFQEEPEDGEGGYSTNSPTIGSKTPVIFFGFELPLCCTHRPSWTRVAYYVVTSAPCFWGCGIRGQVAPTDKAILGRLNVLVALFSLVQVTSALFLFFVMFIPNSVDRDIETQDDITTNARNVDGEIGLDVIVSLWNINTHLFALGVLAVVNLTASVLTIRVIRNVNLAGAIRYLWLLLWVIPFQIYFVIGLFDYFFVTKVWIEHWWTSKSMAWFRDLFCEEDTGNTRCALPEADPELEDAWCQINFNATDCVAIRDDAQGEMERWMLPFYYFNAAWGIFTVVLLLLVVNTLESIISKPLVQKSRESNVPAWLALPMFGCVTLGSVIAFSASSVLSTRSDAEVYWIGPGYLATAGLFFVGALTGWSIKAFSILSVQHKRQKLAAIFIFIAAMAATIVLLLSIFWASIAYSISLVDVDIDNNTRGEVACFLDKANSCTGCQEGQNVTEVCPEWTEDDITRVLQTQAKNSAALAAIFLVHAFSALRFGFGLRKHIIMYQIDYV